jgi:hypothetical protein
VLSDAHPLPPLFPLQCSRQRAQQNPYGINNLEAAKLMGDADLFQKGNPEFFFPREEKAPLLLSGLTFSGIIDSLSDLIGLICRL